jgi:addiction module RelE/StbE family toxin
MREIKYTSRFKRDYRREKSGLYSKKLDALLMEVVNLLAADKPLPHRNFDHPLSGDGAITATAISGRTSFSFTASRMMTLSSWCAWVHIANWVCETRRGQNAAQHSTK